MNLVKIVSLVVAAVGLSSCMTDAQFKKRLSKTLEEDPTIVYDVIKENPLAFIKTLSKANELARKELEKDYQKRIAGEIESSLDQPLDIKLAENDVLRGTPNAPIKLVVYSDFQCPFCERGLNVVEKLEKKYGTDLVYIYRHLPLSNHPQAMISAQYFEAIALQSSDKAYEFHDNLYRNQNKLAKGEKYLKKVAEDLKLDMVKLGKDLHSKSVLDKIERDVQQANEFGMRGTPGYILNGVPIKGAYPIDHFEKIISKLKEKGKITLTQNL